MKRICLLGAAIAGLFIIGATNALAVGSHASARTAATKTKATSKAKSKGAATVKVSCALSFSLMVPSSDTTVTQGAASGDHAGFTQCPAKGLGKGSEADSFTTDAGGDLIGKWQVWFNTGSVYGTYDLTPADNGPSTDQSFSAAGYTGTFVIKGGTGTLAKYRTKTAGTMKCATKDSVHYACKLSGRVVPPVAKK